MAYTDLSASYFHMGNYAQSAAMLEMAIPLLEQQSEKAYLMRALTSASAACIRLNDYQRALEYGLRAQSLRNSRR
jgi:tetratricopeptide (TPR) repeat protein